MLTLPGSTILSKSTAASSNLTTETQHQIVSPSSSPKQKITHISTEDNRLKEYAVTILTPSQQNNLSLAVQGSSPFIPAIDSILKGPSVTEVPQKQASVIKPLRNSSDNVVSHQLEKLIEICKDLSDPTKASREILVNLSWGIGSLPREKKFSKQWCAVVDEIHWLLLEDISRQISELVKGDSPNNNEINKIVREFSQNGAKALGDIFTILDYLENGVPIVPKEKPKTLQIVETLFYHGFDKYVLSQVERNILIILKALETQKPVEWILSDDNHIKALFRTVEVIGEASKILSPNARKCLPTLDFGSAEEMKKNYWGKLRDQLHHSKKRSWEIAKLAPENWVVLLEALFPNIQKEIQNFKNTIGSQEDKPNRGVLDLLCKLCEEDRFAESRRIWDTIKTDFFSDPKDLKRIFLGLEDVKEKDFFKVWKEYAEPHLKTEADINKTQAMVFELLRIRLGFLITDKDIAELTPLGGNLDRIATINEMKRLLNEATLDNAEGIEAFNKLADKFVFLKTSEAPNQSICRDSGKNQEIKELMSEKIRLLKPFHLSEDLFNNTDDQLLDSYIKLKHQNIEISIRDMKKFLGDIKASWPDTLEDQNKLQELKIQKEQRKLQKETLDPRTLFVSEFKRLFPIENKRTLENPFIKGSQSEPLLADCINQLKVFQADATKHLSADNFENSKERCFSAIRQLESFLNGLFSSEDFIRHVVEDDFSQLNIICRAKSTDPNKNQDLIKKAEAIFKFYAFKGPSDANTDQEAAKFIDRLRNKVTSSLKADANTNFEAEFDALVNTAEHKLSSSFVQDALRRNMSEISSEPGKAITASDNIVLLRNIYKIGLDEKNNDNTKNNAWETIERKFNGRRLGAHAIEKVKSWFPKGINEKKSEILKELLEYLDGVKKIKTGDAPRFEHESMKLKIFEVFLQKCILVFPGLTNHRDELFSYFKIANGIIDTENKAQHFIGSFKSKIEKLGGIFSKLLDIEQNDKNMLDLLLLSAEYDLQDIGELAQLITERPLLWNQGRHLLSSRHLLLISLMRKMMAHYPLLLPPEVVRWNLEYLAFDAKKMLSKDNYNDSYDFEPQKRSERKPILKNLESKFSEVNQSLNRLNLRTDDSDILYPLISMPELSYLHPFGEFAIMVLPASKVDTKSEFIYNVMKLELILNYELDTKVTVIGNWNKENNELVNIPSQNHIPEDYLKRIIQQKQPGNQWIKDNMSYDLFQSGQWTEILFKSGREVTRTDSDLHHELMYFLKILNIPQDPDSLEKRVKDPKLNEYIFTILEKLLSEAESNYPQSPLYKWICCLFERFCPAEVEPSFQICIPPSYDEKRPCIAMLDHNQNGLRILPKKMEDQNIKSRPYYRSDGNRLDIYNGHSLLDTPRLVTTQQLKDLAEYAAKTLKAHIGFIKEKIHPEYSLQRSNFRNIDRIRLDDHSLADQPKTLETIDHGIQVLIDKEVQDLAPKMLDMVQSFVNHGPMARNFCKEMLEFLNVKKETARVARIYFGKHRPRLMDAFIKMDPRSKKFFCNWHVVQTNRCHQYPFVISFPKFLDRIDNEANSLKLLPGQKTASGDFRECFKELIPDEQVQSYLLCLMKRATEKLRLITEAGVACATNFTGYHGFVEAKNFTADVPKIMKWNDLFRMVDSCKVLDIILKYIDNSSNKKNSLDQLKSALTADFETQYKNPHPELEGCSAQSSNGGEVSLYDARVYFDGKRRTHKANQQYKRIAQIPNSSCKNKFLENWENIYGVRFKPLYIINPMKEACDALYSLINNGLIPDYNFDTIPSYSDYWNFVEQNPVEMTTLSGRSGLMKSFETYILDGGKLEGLSWYQQNKTNKTYTRICKLLTAYFSFYPLEIRLSTLSNKLSSQIDVHTQLQHEMDSFEGSKINFEAIQYQRRLEKAKCLIDDACTELKKTVKEITSHEFFEMLKLSVVLESLTSNNDELSNDEQRKKALEFLCKEIELTPVTIKHASQITGKSLMTT